ncbi:GDP-mannose 4,6-dehydratase [Candidatus Methylopumilus planktonicus]|uniref:GDP-mannose 4,6-dehydratase n=1 Tax=Candidatus Methylopumilus planktonicus TaxID=1581557 RepID=UPI003BEECF53
MKENILITGITGFVGSHLADYILENFSDKVNLFATRRYHLSRMDNVYHIIDKINWVDCDITDPIACKKLINTVKPSRVFHCAAESFVSPSWDHPTRYMSVNYNGTLNLLEALREIGSDAVFHIPGSGEEYGLIYENELPITETTVLRPVNPYAVTKVAQDLIGYVYNQSYGTKVIRTRAFNHEGPRREKFFGIPWYAYQIAKIELGLQEPVIYRGHIDDVRNFTHVRDMVEAYWISTDVCVPGELYLIGSDDSKKLYTFRQALEMLIKKSSYHGAIIHKEDPKYVRPTNVPRLIGNTSKFRSISGWTPKISFEKILDDTLGYWREQLINNPRR